MFKATIGLEIHAELNTKSKMFCSCRNDPEEKEPNVNICPVCTAQPGALPVANKEAVKKVVKAGLALNCRIAEFSKFDRKNYFYPDLPKGYQISQYDAPFCENGFLEIEDKKIRIRRIHLEEDAGKLIHTEGKNYSLVDFNRAGVPLMELVTEPDINSGEEARRFAQELQLILRYLEISNADMEKGQLRVEVNISLSRDENLGTKVEIKNLNSFRSVEKAIDYEIKRQSSLLEKGEKVVQETRGWNDKRGITVSQRLKEESQDYRYFPEPDLPTLRLSSDFIGRIKDEIIELPQNRRKRMSQRYDLDGKIIEVFVVNKLLGDYFEEVVSNFQNENLKDGDFLKLSRLTANYIVTDLRGLFRATPSKIGDFPVASSNFSDFIMLIYKNEISSKIAKAVLREMVETGKGPLTIIKEKDLRQITNEGEIEKIVEKVIKENEKAVSDYKSGKESAFQFLIGQVMRETKGKAKPELISKILKNTL
ncbi:MAG TPA: Asp-tRNA(Asn)/Glu-tRNA(Gln) amidotransferase subunit GatB [Candidatus Parcubacteria bacterium]|nr:Asp-tRNA(Asn)/Glu-tRNA(Gln) amidotransferase subunit GatB [Candidatus Parcubacteria bacterium]